MSAIKAPAKILKLWKKINDRFGPQDEGKKTAGKEKTAEKQSEKITKGLTVLRNVVRSGVKTPSEVKRFEKTRDKVARVMTVYCKTIRSTKLESAKDMNKFRKAVRQLTIVVRGLEVFGLDAADEGDVDMNVLTAVDDSGLDQLMDDPKLGEGDDISFDDEQETTESQVEETPGKAPMPPQAPPPPKSNDASRFTARLKALLPAIQKIQATGLPTGNEVKQLVADANAAARQNDFAEANARLDRVEALLKQTPPTTPGAKSPPTPGVKAKDDPSPVPPAVHKTLLLAVQAYRAASDTVDAQISALAAALRRETDEDLLEIADKGMNALTGNHKVRLMAALREATSTDPKVLRTVAAKGMPLVKSFRNHISSDERVLVCDENPFGVTVSIRQTLGGALDGLEQAFGDVKTA